MKQLPPLIFFAYNRPDHLERMITSLLKCNNVAKYDAYFFSDGPKNEKAAEGVRGVREYLKTVRGFKSVKIVEKAENWGLAKSVIAGVSEIINQFGRAIVIEDDLEFSPSFLDFMTEALNKYESNKNVFSLGGYTPNLSIPNDYNADLFLSYRCCTWGWATWRDRWNKVDWKVSDYASFSKDVYEKELFNRGGKDMSQLLDMQMNGKIDSWGIRWDYAHHKNQSFCLRPVKSLVHCFGNDGSGVHCSATSQFDVQVANKIPNFPEADTLKVNKAINFNFARFYDGLEPKSVSQDLWKLWIKSHVHKIRGSLGFHGQR